MPCGAGYPERPCPFGHEGRVTRAACGACVNFVPPAHILAWCILWDRDGVVCKLPRSACDSCALKVRRPPGRPPGEGPDLRDPGVRLAYDRDYRAKNRDRVRENQRRFKERHPGYQAQWRADHPEALRQYARDSYRKKTKKGGDQ